MKFFKCVLSVVVFLLLVVSCKKDPVAPKELIPTISDIEKVYKGETLSLMINGQVQIKECGVEIKNSENGFLIILESVIEGSTYYTITDTKFEVATKSYYSKISGERTDYFLGKKVVVEGEIENGILKMNITTTALEREYVEGSILKGRIFKCKMSINVGGDISPDTEQFVYFETAKSMSPTRTKLTIKNFSFNGVDYGNISLDTLPVIKGGDDLYIVTNNYKITLKDKGDFNSIVKCSIIKNQLYIRVVVQLSVDSGKAALIEFTGEERVAEPNISIKSEYILDDAVLSNKAEFTFSVKDNTSADKLIFTPKLEIPVGATLKTVKSYIDSKSTEIAIDTPIDFSKVTKVVYSIQAEGASSTTAYTLLMKKIAFAESFKFSFDNWTELISGSWQYQNPSPANVLATSNAGAVMLINIFGYKGGYPVLETEDAKSGHAAQLVSRDTRGMIMTPALTSGSMFLGEFILDISAPLTSTKFGIPFTQKPLRFKGYYKYTAGSLFIDGSAKPPIEVVGGKKDKFAISAVLYEVNSYVETLTGVDVNTSSKIVATAVVPNDNEQAVYTAFDVEFKWLKDKQYDKSKKYKLAFICSSSADGDKYIGAVNSTLFIDEFEITVE